MKVPKRYLEFARLFLPFARPDYAIGSVRTNARGIIVETDTDDSRWIPLYQSDLVYHPKLRLGLVARTDYTKFNIVDLETGNRWWDPQSVGDLLATIEERKPLLARRLV